MRVEKAIPALTPLSTCIRFSELDSIDKISRLKGLGPIGRRTARTLVERELLVQYRAVLRLRRIGEPFAAHDYDTPVPDYEEAHRRHQRAWSIEPKPAVFFSAGPALKRIAGNLVCRGEPNLAAPSHNLLLPQAFVRELRVNPGAAEVWVPDAVTRRTAGPDRFVPDAIIIGPDVDPEYIIEI